MKTNSPFTKRESELIAKLFSKGIIKPNYYSGSGRFAKKSADHAKFLVEALERNGMREGWDFTKGNDSPRLGHSGHFVKLLVTNRKLEAFEEFKK